MKKNSVLIVGAVGTLLFGFLVFLGTDTCYVNTTCKILRGAILNGSSVVTFFFPGILFFSLITYKMSEAVFISWSRFAYVWVPLSMILILVSDDSPGHLFVSAQEFVAILLWGLYVIISLILIVRKYFSLRRNSEQA